MKHQTRKHDQMQTSQGGRKPLIIADQPSEAGSPGKRAFDHPTARQQDEAAPGLRKFDHFQLDAVLLSRFCRNIARIGLIHESQFNRLAGHVLDCLSQRADLRPILLVRRSHQEGEQVTQRIHGRMHFAAFASPGSIVAGMTATFRCRLQRATIEEGCRLRPLASRSIKRRSSTRAAKQPAANQRWVCC